MDTKPYMVKQTITFSDGTETVLNYTQNENQAEIEKTVAEAIEGHTSDEDAEIVNETVAETTETEVEVVEESTEVVE